MLRSPNLYFPSKLEEQGVAWVQSELSTYPKDPKSIQVDSQVFSYALHRGWVDLARESAELFTLKYSLDHEMFTYLRQLFGVEGLKAALSASFNTALRESIGWIALSSNQPLLDDFLVLYPPQYMVSVCRDPALLRRISLMLHLSCHTNSYMADGELVDKNSVFFRDWVMYRLPGAHPADRKLLAHFFANRFNRRYPEYDLLSGSRVFGLLGDKHVPRDPLRVLDLTFTKAKE